MVVGPCAAFIVFRRQNFGRRGRRLASPKSVRWKHKQKSEKKRGKKMRNLKSAKNFIFGMLTMALIFSLAMTVLADPVWKTVQIFYNNIKIILDGEELIPKNVNGDIVDPFIMDGTTYLPVRAISEALGLDVEWDGNNWKVYLTTPTTPRPRDILQAFEIRGTDNSAFYEENQSFKMLGNDYSGYLWGNQSWMSSGIVRHLSEANISTFYNLEGKYKTIKGTLGRIDGTGTRAGTFSIYLDDELFTGFTLTSTMPTHEIIIDVTDVRILRIEVFIEAQSSSTLTQYGFGNVTVE